jgi:ABC-type polysaccharide transport system permease subunit
VAATYIAIYEHQQFIMNVLKVILTLSVVVYFCYMVNEESRKKVIEEYRAGNHLPKWMDQVTYLSLVVMMAGSGHFWMCGMAIFISSVDFWMRDLSTKK